MVDISREVTNTLQPAEKMYLKKLCMSTVDEVVFFTKLNCRGVTADSGDNDSDDDNRNDDIQPGGEGGGGDASLSHQASSQKEKRWACSRL